MQIVQRDRLIIEGSARRPGRDGLGAEFECVALDDTLEMTVEFDYDSMYMIGYDNSDPIVITGPTETFEFELVRRDGEPYIPHNDWEIAAVPFVRAAQEGLREVLDTAVGGVLSPDGYLDDGARMAIREDGFLEFVEQVYGEDTDVADVIAIVLDLAADLPLREFIDVSDVTLEDARPRDD